MDKDKGLIWRMHQVKEKIRQIYAQNPNLEGAFDPYLSGKDIGKLESALNAYDTIVRGGIEIKRGNIFANMS